MKVLGYSVLLQRHRFVAWTIGLEASFNGYALSFTALFLKRGLSLTIVKNWKQTRPWTTSSSDT